MAAVHQLRTAVLLRLLITVTAGTVTYTSNTSVSSGRKLIELLRCRKTRLHMVTASVYSTHLDVGKAPSHPPALISRPPLRPRPSLPIAARESGERLRSSVAKCIWVHFRHKCAPF